MTLSILSATLADDGNLIIKFFLHISKQEQKRRFNRLLKDPLTAWHVSPEDWDHHYRYDDWLMAYEEAFERTESEWGPWTIVEATEKRFTMAKIYRTIITALEERLGWQHLALPSAAEIEQAGVAEPESETEDVLGEDESGEGDEELEAAAEED